MPPTVDLIPPRPMRGTRRGTVVMPPPAPPHLRTLRAWLGGMLALYVTALQLAADVSRTVWDWPVHIHPTASVAPGALLFAALRAMPLGYFAAFGLRRRRALLIAAGAAILVEVAFQLIGAVRRDPFAMLAPMAAASGAVVGAVGFLVVAARMRARAANDAVILAPDLPLVGGAYVTTPLLWLAADAEASSNALRGGWCALLLGLFGAVLLSSARASRGIAGGRIAGHAGVAALWCAVGMAPLLVIAPMRTAASIGLVAAFAALYPVLLGMRGRERRVEGPALRRAMPFLGFYVVLSALAPVAATRAGTPHSWLGWVTIDAAAAASGWAEPIALFAVIGYVLAELRGRREEAASAAWRGLGPFLGLAAAAVAGLRVVASAAPAASLTVSLAIGFGIATAASVLAARVGMSLYAVQRGYARVHAARGVTIAGRPAAACAPRAAPVSRSADPFARWARPAEPVVTTV